MTDPGPLEVSVHIAARPETVFAYFTDAARYTQWMGSHATLEPVPGGVYQVGMRDGIQAAGEFVEIDPPRRLVFTWGWTNDPAVAPGSTRVVVTFHEEDGGTRVVLHHHCAYSTICADRSRPSMLTCATAVASAIGMVPGPVPTSRIRAATLAPAS
jgi:uncharacterized protein YndB with AHSA1/START domain